MDNTQNILEYFDALQIEYYITEIRKKIYPTPSDKRHYGKVMKLKEDKIKDIAVKNSLVSIFTEGSKGEKKRAEFIKRVFPVQGLPLFGKYLKKEDVTNYYSKNSLVKVYESEDSQDDDFITGTILSYDYRTNSISIQIDDKEVKIKSHLVTRIL